MHFKFFTAHADADTGGDFPGQPAESEIATGAGNVPTPAVAGAAQPDACPPGGIEDLLESWEEAARRDARAEVGNCDDLLEAWEQAARQDAAAEPAAEPAAQAAAQAAAEPALQPAAQPVAEQAADHDPQEKSEDSAGQRRKPEDSKRRARRFPVCVPSKKRKPVIILAAPAEERQAAEPTSEALFNPTPEPQATAAPPAAAAAVPQHAKAGGQPNATAQPASASKSATVPQATVRQGEHAPRRTTDIGSNPQQPGTSACQSKAEHFASPRAETCRPPSEHSGSDQDVLSHGKKDAGLPMKPPSISPAISCMSRLENEMRHFVSAARTSYVSHEVIGSVDQCLQVLQRHMRVHACHIGVQGAHCSGQAGKAETRAAGNQHASNSSCRGSSAERGAGEESTSACQARTDDVSDAAEGVKSQPNGKSHTSIPVNKPAPARSGVPGDPTRSKPGSEPVSNAGLGARAAMQQQTPSVDHAKQAPQPSPARDTEPSPVPPFAHKASHLSGTASAEEPVIYKHVESEEASLPQAPLATEQATDSSEQTNRHADAETFNFSAQGTGSDADRVAAHVPKGEVQKEPPVLHGAMCQDSDEPAEAICNLSFSRQKNAEVEAAEWARRQAVIQQKERLAAAERAAVKRAREQRENEAAQLILRQRLREEKKQAVKQLVKGKATVREVLQALNFHVDKGPAAEKSALRKARIHFHPDQMQRKGAPLPEQIMAEEIFKYLGSLA